MQFYTCKKNISVAKVMLQKGQLTEKDRGSGILLYSTVTAEIIYKIMSKCIPEGKNENLSLYKTNENLSLHTIWSTHHIGDYICFEE